MRLFIIRHGKAEQHSATGRDRDRALTERGVRQAEWLAKRFAAASVRPMVVVSSPFVRARQTAEPIAAALGLEVVFDERLEVGASPGDVLEVAVEVSESAEAAVAVVGHNPTFQSLVDSLVRDGFEMNTGACAEVEIEIGGSKVKGKLIARHRMDDE